MARPKKGLGKGLDALFQENHLEDKPILSLKLSEIEPNADQPRSNFDDTALRELADSISSHGVLQPLVVRPLEAGGYQIVAGERRWRASRMAGLMEIPVVVRELDDMETLEIAIIENLQREDLNPVELAVGYKALMDEHQMTQEQVAEKVGKSRPVIANTVRLLALSDDILKLIRDGSITSGHGKALLGIEDDKFMGKVAQRIIKEGLLVRDVEKIARLSQNKEKSLGKQRSSRPNKGWGGDSFYKEMELALSTELGRKVVIKGSEEKATLVVEFYSKEELKDLAKRLMSAQ